MSIYVVVAANDIQYVCSRGDFLVLDGDQWNFTADRPAATEFTDIGAAEIWAEDLGCVVRCSDDVWCWKCLDSGCGCCDGPESL